MEFRVIRSKFVLKIPDVLITLIPNPDSMPVLLERKAPVRLLLDNKMYETIQCHGFVIAGVELKFHNIESLIEDDRRRGRTGEWTDEQGDKSSQGKADRREREHSSLRPDEPTRSVSGDYPVITTRPEAGGAGRRPGCIQTGVALTVAVPRSHRSANHCGRSHPLQQVQSSTMTGMGEELLDHRGLGDRGSAGQ